MRQSFSMKRDTMLTTAKLLESACKVLLDNFIGKYKLIQCSFQSFTAAICLVLGTACGLPQLPSGINQVFSTLSEGQQQGEVDNNEQVPYTSIQNITEVSQRASSLDKHLEYHRGE